LERRFVSLNAAFDARRFAERFRLRKKRIHFDSNIFYIRPVTLNVWG
jgi:hypothetical protein